MASLDAEDMAVRFAGQRRVLSRGHRLTFGRGTDRALRIATEPEDPVVSRHAGHIQHDGDVWVVHNSSSRAEHTLQPRPGRPVEVGPGCTVGLPSPYTVLQVLGRDGTYDIVLDGRAVAARATGRSRPAGGVPTQAPPEVHGPELVLLAALCERLLLCAGLESRHTTPTEIATRLDRSAKGVSARLVGLRDRLIREGVTDLMIDTGTTWGSWTARLANWAIRNEIVTLRTLALLPPRREP